MKRLLVLLALAGCTPEPSQYSMTCEHVAPSMDRCYNFEAVCYRGSGGMICWKVGQ